MLFLDTSALLKRYVEEEGTERVLALMAGDEEWCASELARAEAQVTVCHLDLDPPVELQVIDALREDWERFVVVPVDEVCLAQAADIGCATRVRTLDAIHLAAADRVPRPLAFLSFDVLQVEAARSLGLDVA